MIVHWKAGAIVPAAPASKPRRVGARRRPSLRPRPELLEGRVAPAGGGGWSDLPGVSLPPVQISSSPATDTYVQEAKLTSPVPSDDLSFGWGSSLTADGETLAIGAPGDGSVPGAVYVYARNERVWTETARLAPPEGVTAERFGLGVAISGDGSTLAVTSLMGDWPSNGASLHVYSRSGADWDLAQTLTLEVNNGFGGWISISDDGSVIAGGAGYDEARIGAAYVFSRVDGVYVMDDPVVPPDGAVGGFFGEPAALSGDGRTLAVGSYRFPPEGGIGTGAVDVYERSGTSWVHMTSLTAPPGTVVGPRVAINGDGTVILARGSTLDSSGTPIDAGLVFTRSGSTWNKTAELLDPDPSWPGSFGSWVALSPDGRTAVISASYRLSAGVFVPGSAYVFAQSGSSWSLVGTLTDPDGAPNDNFGVGVAIRDGTIAVTSSGATVGGIKQGAVLVYHNPQGFAVIADPLDRTSPPRTIVTFTAAARGADSIATRWQVSVDGGSTWADVPGGTSPWLSFVATAADSGNLYRAVFTDGGGTTLVTHAAALSVVEAAPVVTITSGVNPARFHEAMTFTIRVASDGSTPRVPDGGTVTFSIGDYRALAVVHDGAATIQVPPNMLRPGSYVATAVYDGAGDPVFASASGTLTQLVLRAATSVTAHITPDPYVTRPVTIYALITQDQAGLPSETRPKGHVYFEDSGYALGAAQVQEPGYPTPGDPAYAGFYFSFIRRDDLSIVAYYSGDEWNEPSVSSPLFLSVPPAPTATAVYSTYPSFTYYGVPVPVKIQTLTTDYAHVGDGWIRGIVDGGEPFWLTYSDGEANTHLWNLEAGGHFAEFEYRDAYDRYVRSSASVGIAVHKAPTTVTLASTKSVSNAGETLVFTATVLNAATQDPANAGVVHFYVGERLVATVPVGDFGRARLATSALVPGVYTLTAVYQESKNYQASQSAHLVQRVEPLPIPPRPATTTTLTTSAPSSVAGVEVTFTATVAGSGGASHPTSGRVAFYIGGALVAYAAVGSDGAARLATSALVPGSYTVSAVFEESAAFQGSQAASISQLILPAAAPIRGAATTTALTSTANPASTGRSLMFFADVAGGSSNPTSGLVRFYLGLDAIAERPIDPSGRATLEARFDAPGGYLITAVYLGANGFATSQSDHLGQVVIAPASTSVQEPPATAPVVTPWAARRAARAERLARLALRRPPAMRGRA